MQESVCGTKGEFAAIRRFRQLSLRLVVKEARTAATAPCWPHVLFFVLIQPHRGPERYGASRRFETTPSNPIRSAAARNSTPSSKPSDSRSRSSPAPMTRTMSKSLRSMSGSSRTFQPSWTATQKPTRRCHHLRQCGNAEHQSLGVRGGRRRPIYGGPRHSGSFASTASTAHRRPLRHGSSGGC